MPESASTSDLAPLLRQLSPQIIGLVTSVDDLVHRVDPDVVRVVWPHQRTVGYGVGPRKMSEHYAYVTVHERHVNLGCNFGARLDSGGLLEGAGASMRKMTVRDAADLDDPRVVPLLRAARQERLAALGRP
jgi:hypothetical protein